MGQRCAACDAPCVGGVVCDPCIGQLSLARASRQRCDCCATVFGAWRSKAYDNVDAGAQENQSINTDHGGLMHRAHLCGACISKPPAFDAAITLGDFNAPLSGLISQLKFGHRLSLSAWFAGQLDELIRLSHRQHQHRFDLIVPVPLHETRLRERGFNQSWEIVKRMQHPALKQHALQRLRDTPSQRSVTAAQRFANVRGAFAWCEPFAAPQGLHVLLVDDVVTTTATVQAASKALKQAGAARVTVACVARVSD